MKENNKRKLELPEFDDHRSNKTEINEEFDILEVPIDGKYKMTLKPIYPNDRLLIILSRGATLINTLAMVIGIILLVMNFITK